MSQKKVVGVRFGANDDAPVVVLKGAGPEAQSALSQAQDAGDLPVVRDSSLVDALYRVPIDQPIGRELFPVMAAILVHVMQIDRRQGERPRE